MLTILSRYYFFFFFNDTATTEIYTLSLHDALPISRWTRTADRRSWRWRARGSSRPDRKSTRLNSSHGYISYAVFCLKKKKKEKINSNLLIQRCSLGVEINSVASNITN